MTSSNVVSFLRKHLNIKKAGHCGTLDPGAAGVLCVCIGKATKITDYLMGSDKKYRAEFTFGKETDTLDSYGTVTQTSDVIVTKEDMEKIIPCFIGEIDQIPPMYSAIKKDGQKLCNMARKGKSVEIDPRKVFIKNIELIKAEDNRFLLDIECSKGTYIRTLCADMAKKANTVGYMSFLQRTYGSGFDSQEGYSLDEIKEMIEKGDLSFIKDMEAALSFMPKFTLDDYLFKIITTGSAIELKKIRNAHEAATEVDNLVYCAGKLIGIAKPSEGLMKIKTLLYTGEEK